VKPSDVLNSEMQPYFAYVTIFPIQTSIFFFFQASISSRPVNLLVDKSTLMSPRYLKPNMSGLLNIVFRVLSAAY
jgi:hypothetical protein